MGDYENYIWGDIWRDKSELFLKLHGKKCYICEKKKYLQVHHLHYNTLMNESSRDLIAVCKECHKKIHNNELTGGLSEWNFEKTKEGKQVWN